MKKTIAIIILIIICLGLGGYIAYDKLYAEKEPIEKKDITIKIEDGLSIEEEREYGSDGCKVSIDTVLPKVLVNGKEVNKIKSKLDDVFTEKMNAAIDDTINAIEETYKTSKEMAAQGYNIDFSDPCYFAPFTKGKYDYAINGNVILLHLDYYTTYKSPVWFMDEFIFYDAENDKILSYEEGFKIFGYTLDDFKKIITETGTTEVNEFNTIDDLFDEYHLCGMHLKEIENHKVLKFEYVIACE